MGTANSLSSYISGLGAASAMNNFSAAPSGDITAVWTYFKELRGGVSTQSIDFGSTLVSTPTQTNFTITNLRSVAAGYTLGSITGSNSANFTVTSNPCVNSITAGATCTIEVTFTPSAAGSKSASLALTFDASSTPIALSGVGSAPTFSIASSTLSPTATAGTTSTASTTLSNTGTANLVLGTLTFSGSESGDYSLASGNTCTASLTLPAASSCTLVVQFAPAIAVSGARNATLTITHNATGSPQSVTINGTANAAPRPAITLSNNTLAYPDTQLGSNSSLTLTVGNNGQAALVFSGISVGGIAAADYSKAGTCSSSGTLAINATCTVVLTFTPSALGARTAALTITSDSSTGASTVIALSGSGIPVPVPLVTLSATEILFGNQTLNGLYQARTINLTNSGTATLNLSSLTLTGAAFSFVTSPPCANTLAAGATCPI
ncbi:MAG: choice-of-anchor D domain-containing protein, partial [Pseudomonadota bacterium]